jgi:ribonuclease HI
MVRPFIVKSYPKNVCIYGSVNYDGYSQDQGGFGVCWENGEYEDASVSLTCHATHNIALIQAVLYAIQEDIDGRGELRILTNNSYVINTFTRWHKIWSRNGWRLSNGERPKNMQLILRVLNAIEQRVGSVCFRMVHWEDDYQPLSDARMLARDAMHACYY